MDAASWGIILIFAGFIIAFLGIIISISGSMRREGGEVEGGGIIMVGPIPLIFGKGSRWILPALAIALFLIIFSLILHLG
ncbi:MAG: DUF131 domain-containing protein [Candidatus Bathyarchaeia archaeon]|nr:DUF131 domain-containing protein [Candidatus Bathyarchaeota archaeon]